jgi:DNA-binding transcriptional MocR family regulator
VLLPEVLMQPYRLVKSTADVHSSVLSQAVADAYLAQDRLASRVVLARRSYATKAKTMADALAADAPAIAFDRPPGGMFLWAELPEGCPAIDFARHALDAEGVAVVPGDPFYDSRPETTRLRLSFSQGTLPGLADGVARIAAAWRSWGRA